MEGEEERKKGSSHKMKLCGGSLFFFFFSTFRHSSRYTLFFALLTSFEPLIIDCVILLSSNAPFRKNIVSQSLRNTYELYFVSFNIHFVLINNVNIG